MLQAFFRNSQRFLGCPDVLFWIWNPSHPTSIHQKLVDEWYDNDSDSVTPSDDMKCLLMLNMLKVFWLRIPQVDDLTRLKVVGTSLANSTEKKKKTKHEMGLKKLNTWQMIKTHGLAWQNLSILWGSEIQCFAFSTVLVTPVVVSPRNCSPKGRLRWQPVPLKWRYACMQNIRCTKNLQRE